MADLLGDAQAQQQGVQPGAVPAQPQEGYMHKFGLYETRSKLYMVGRDINRTYWKVLQIDRAEPCELNIREDSTAYSERECSDLLRRIHEGNKATGGLKLVTTCYGIVGFIKFLGPYYMLLITQRRQIGVFCGHIIYSVSKIETVPVQHSTFSTSTVNWKSEDRYKKLLCMVDLTKDFYFSYSYNIMRSLQKNMCDKNPGPVLYETMFVWNEFLTRGVRNILQNTLWTVALVYGYFKQTTLAISGRDVRLTLIARRSRHYAGTRYLKRGVNEKGKVANDVETEQIVVEDGPHGFPMQISSVVQNRGSIPLFWSQETSRINLKPDIKLSKRDETYEATRLHFEHLIKRYGNPIIILNLIKTNEKKPRESILRAEFSYAIEVINKDLPEENRLKFLHWDLHKHSRSKATNVLQLLGRVAAYALTLTGFFYCEVTSALLSDGHLKWPAFENVTTPDSSAMKYPETDTGKHNFDENEDSDSEKKSSGCNNTLDNNNSSVKPLTIQRGVLRTNCIDCLDRTNVAQYAYGWAALGHQLRALGVTNSTKLDLDDPLAEELMNFYERMGDTLAQQYGGSAAHNKIFSERRGQWKAAIQSQEFFRTLQRYYSNAYVDAEKQNAINIFLGNFQPQPGKPDLWDLDSAQFNLQRHKYPDINDNGRSWVTRSWSEGPSVSEQHSPTCSSNLNNRFHSADFSTEAEGTSERQLAYLRCAPTTREMFLEMQRDRCTERENSHTSDCSNFVDVEWLSSCGNSFEEERLTHMSSESVLLGDQTPSTSECESSTRGRERSKAYDEAEVFGEFSDSFVRWVTNGETLCH